METLEREKMTLPRELLAEVLQSAPADNQSVKLLLASIDRLPPYERFKATGLTAALHNFIDRIPTPRKADAEDPLADLISGFNDVLDREPHIERRDCKVSEEFKWLLAPAMHAVERLVAAKSDIALSESAIAILYKVPLARFWRDSDIEEYKNRLQDLVPQWSDLNDRLYWYAIDQARAARTDKEQPPMRDDRFVRHMGHYFSFGKNSLERVLNWVSHRTEMEDRLIALSAAFGIYISSDRDQSILDTIRQAVTGSDELEQQLEEMLNPPVSESEKGFRERQALREEGYKRREREEEQSRSEWIARLKANPDRVRNPPGLEPGECSNDQLWLLREIEGDGLRTSRGEAADWRILEKEFGSAVASAFRDAAMAHWRAFRPELRSEGGDTASIPYSLIFAMTGLEIEAAEREDFPSTSSEAEIENALRYITWELNGFPTWLERTYQSAPALTIAAIGKELFWELRAAKSDTPIHYILHDLVFYSPWLHGVLTPLLLEWLEDNTLSNADALRYVVHILKGGGADATVLANLAKSQAYDAAQIADAAPWFALWVDAVPDTGIPALEAWLSELEDDDAKPSAEMFAAALLGRRGGEDTGPRIGNFRTVEHLRALFYLMHRYIRAEDDINRADQGVYSPVLRDEAQEARDRLFQLLSEFPGKEAYETMLKLSKEHPDERARPWMEVVVRRRAEADGDLEPWSVDQIKEFSAKRSRTPETNRQLFDLSVARLSDLKNWLERGHDSPAQTWARVESENEMRNLIAGWLNQNWGAKYTTAQEPEIANSQRIDIWLQSPEVRSPVPIELKLLDKGWSGQKLCERLRNQLAGDYLREEDGGHGIMLLVHQGTNTGRRWKIAGKLVTVDGLAQALQSYWQFISEDFPNVAAIEIVVIDLSERASVSEV